MSILVKRQDESVALNEREPFLRLYEEGSVGAVSSYNFQEGPMYEYQIDIPSDVQGKSLFVFVKSDFDFMFAIDNQADDRTKFVFQSSSNISKLYRIYADYSLGSFTSTTDYGAVIYSESSELIYDSRIAEAVYKDSFIFDNNLSSFSHASSNPAWYSLNTIVAPIESVSGPLAGTNALISHGIRQTSSTGGNIETVTEIVGNIGFQNIPFSNPCILLDNQYL